MQGLFIDLTIFLKTCSLWLSETQLWSPGPTYRRRNFPIWPFPHSYLRRIVITSLMRFYFISSCLLLSHMRATWAHAYSISKRSDENWQNVFSFKADICSQKFLAVWPWLGFRVPSLPTPLCHTYFDPPGCVLAHGTTTQYMPYLIKKIA